MQGKRKQIQDYLAKNVNVFVQPMVYEIVKKRPADPAAFAAQWIQDYLAKRSNKNTYVGSDSQSETEQVPFDNSKFEKAKQRGKKRSRMGISEEVFGDFNKKDAINFRCIPKSQDSKQLILSLIRSSILFANLGAAEQNTVIDAMEEKSFQKGDHVIDEGEKGDCLYIVSDGAYDCYKKIDGQNKYLKTYKKGEAFGELALMYNAPRAATIIANGPGRVFALDRSTFSQIVKQAAIKKRQLFQNVISNVSIFSDLSQYQKEQFFDVLKEQKYQEGEYVINQGDYGNYFYIVLEGKLVAEKRDLENPASQPVKVYEYEQGNYFGELALLHDIKRQASVKAVTRVNLACIERDSFMRLLGSLEDILKRNEQRYKVIQQQIAA